MKLEKLSEIPTESLELLRSQLETFRPLDETTGYSFEARKDLYRFYSDVAEELERRKK